MHRLTRLVLSLSCLALAASPALIVAEAGAKGKPRAYSGKLPPRPGCSYKWNRTKERLRDVDRDGLPNIVDPDIDGDRKANGTDMNIDGDRLANTRDKEIDADAIPNQFDRDIDSDRRINGQDRDMDGDGIPNIRDRDMDADGIANAKDRDKDADCKADGRGTYTGPNGDGNAGGSGDDGDDTPGTGDCETPDRNEALNEQNEDADTTADEKDPCPAGEQDAAAPSGDTSEDCDTPRTATTESSTTRTTRRPTAPSQERLIQAAKPRLGCDDEYPSSHGRATRPGPSGRSAQRRSRGGSARTRNGRFPR